MRVLFGESVVGWAIAVGDVARGRRRCWADLLSFKISALLRVSRCLPDTSSILINVSGNVTRRVLVISGGELNSLFVDWITLFVISLIKTYYLDPRWTVGICSYNIKDVSLCQQMHRLLYRGQSRIFLFEQKHRLVYQAAQTKVVLGFLSGVDPVVPLVVSSLGCHFVLFCHCEFLPTHILSLIHI